MAKQIRLDTADRVQPSRRGEGIAPFQAPLRSTGTLPVQPTRVFAKFPLVILIAALAWTPLYLLLS